MKMVTIGYVVENKRMGGAQASINVPSEFFDYLCAEKVISLDTSRSNALSNSNSRFTAYSLSNDFSLSFSSTMLNLVGNANKKLGLFIIEGEGIKPQMRPTQYSLVGKIENEFDFTWLSKLIDRSVHNSSLVFYCDLQAKTLSIDYRSNIDTDIQNACY
ncbi:hypothetical protein MGH68_14840 [Erysipelothrix sp. D19-032]